MTITEKPSDFVLNEGQSSSSSTQLVLVEDGSILIPDAAALLSGTFDKVGNDLLVISPAGAQFLVQDFFLFDPSPVLIDGTGLMVSGDVAARLAAGKQPVQVAQEGEADGTAPIGVVQTAEGEVTVELCDYPLIFVSFSAVDSFFQSSPWDCSDSKCRDQDRKGFHV